MFNLFRSAALVVCLFNLAACDKAVPNCSAQLVEATVSRLITPHDVTGTADTMQVRMVGTNYVATVHPTFDAATILAAYTVVYDNERQQDYDPDSKTRLCLAHVTITFDPAKAARGVTIPPEVTALDLMSPNSPTYKFTMTAEQITAAKQILLNDIGFGHLANQAGQVAYSAQLNDKGETYVRVGG